MVIRWKEKLYSVLIAKPQCSLKKLLVSLTKKKKFLGETNICSQNEIFFLLAKSFVFTCENFAFYWVTFAPIWKTFAFANKNIWIPQSNFCINLWNFSCAFSCKINAFLGSFTKMFLQDTLLEKLLIIGKTWRSLQKFVCLQKFHVRLWKFCIPMSNFWACAKLLHSLTNSFAHKNLWIHLGNVCVLLKNFAFPQQTFGFAYIFVPPRNFARVSKTQNCKSFANRLKSSPVELKSFTSEC